MRILITNDDGISGTGLIELAKNLSTHHEVWVIAPDKNRSAISHAITMTDPLGIVKIKEKWFSCSGVPVDCVVSGLKAILPITPDVVISGINKGANIGTDVLFSGTCSAARQAALYGIPGIALSLEGNEKGRWNYKPLAEFVKKNIDALVSLCDRDIFLNVNAKSAESYKGWRITSLSRRSYGDTVEKYTAPDGRFYAFFKGGQIATDGEPDSDYIAVEDGLISISRVYAQPVIADDKKGMDLVLDL